jgi:protocatechuate 3,4-dioxygenase beta subunit
MKFSKGLTLVLCLLVAMILVASGVAQETTAGLQGTIKDPQGAVVSGATVEVSGPALIGVKKVTTDAGGYYRFANLPPGTYAITVTAQGF